MMLQQFIWLGLAGAAGTLARVGLSSIVYRLAGSRYPWGTLSCNLLGCALFGLIWAAAEQRLGLSPKTKLVLLTGFLGAFTTFSTYAFDTSQLLSRGQWVAAAVNVAAQNMLGVAAIFAGLALGRQLS